MTKKIIAAVVGIVFTYVVRSQSSVDSLVQSEPTSQQKLILYGMTALGILLIGLGLKNTKLFKKK